MKIQILNQTKNSTTFKSTYLDWTSIKRYGSDSERILKALMNNETPLYKALEHLDHPSDERAIGDTFISLEKFRSEMELIPTLRFNWPRLLGKGEKPFDYGVTPDFSNYGDDYIDDTDKLCEYIKSDEIVKDLKKRLKTYKKLMPSEKTTPIQEAFKSQENMFEYSKQQFLKWLDS